MRNHLRINETENDICTSLKSELCFRFPSTKSTLTCFNSGRIYATINGKYVHHNRESAKIGCCTSLKSISISGFVDTRDKVNAD